MKGIILTIFLSSIIFAQQEEIIETESIIITTDEEAIKMIGCKFPVEYASRVTGSTRCRVFYYPQGPTI